jgi:hypothetical protein
MVRHPADTKSLSAMAGQLSRALETARRASGANAAKDYAEKLRAALDGLDDLLLPADR